MKKVNFVTPGNHIHLVEGSETIFYKILQKKEFEMTLEKVYSYPTKREMYENTIG